MYLSRLLLLATAVATTATASSLTITIPSTNVLPNPHVLPAGTHATLTAVSRGDSEGKESPIENLLTASLTRSSTFVFRNLPDLSGPESYLLDIRSAEYVFAPFRVDVDAHGSVSGVWETFRGNAWDNRGGERYIRGENTDVNANVVIEAKVLARRTFYAERPQFSPLDLFKNPMILLAVVAMLFTFGMPKLMENMDPEMRAEFEKQSRASPIAGAGRSAPGAAAANFDLAGWMAGTAPGPMAGMDSGKASASGRESERARKR
ncbi:hypothetical protein ASPZODRAFT_134256 [Penicilliopsis zonata CBS 506.65]|uniref:ER membrane protein complex subunit 7 beta-sandwich domain-containing protein n=1 Tax=Penicilliopsis zonata CBS 506.65 TaxID=1073090 RepID=A0A1L9SCP0_9EURO|nr:hypothetical protein ASPZODRAFT_134256 [Penicilliopsis zonata CBS 506.65]OJJ44857.1 hypothetical protein ASPZODRAFT_134256 [Penicilliopsis zonata CBS 506.65]